MDVDEEPVLEEDTDEPTETHQLYEETLVNQNQAVDFAPGEGQVPLSMKFDEFCEELAFPQIFGGHARNPNPEVKNLSYNDIINSELRRTDRRAVIPEHLLYVYKKSQLEQLGSCINIQMKKAAQDGLKASDARNQDYINTEIASDNAFQFMNTITGTPAYWELQKKKVMAMVRQFGICTFFITLSAAETQWKDLLRILMKTVKGVDNADVDNLSFEQKAELIRKDPVTCALYFDHRFKEVLKTWKNTTEGPFKQYTLKHQYYRIEFQHRGSPHVHMLCWLEGAPTFDGDNPQNIDEITEFIDSIITTNSENPDVKDCIQYQYHRCTKTCYKRSFSNNKTCRFGAPFPPMRKTMILSPLTEEPAPEDAKKNRQFVQDMKELLNTNSLTDFDDFLRAMKCTEDQYIHVLRSQLKSNKVFLKRAVKDTRVNAYSPKILMCMESNMDIQYILDPYACINYIVDYISKPARGISRLLQSCVDNLRHGNHSLFHQLKCVCHCFYNGTEISAQECAWCRLKLTMSYCSSMVEFINTSLANVSFSIMLFCIFININSITFRNVIAF